MKMLSTLEYLIDKSIILTPILSGFSVGSGLDGIIYEDPNIGWYKVTSGLLLAGATYLYSEQKKSKTVKENKRLLSNLKRRIRINSAYDNNYGLN